MQEFIYKPNFYLSNRVETLYEGLVHALQDRKRGTRKKIIVVPSPAMKEWLLGYMADHQGVAFGFTLFLPHQLWQMLGRWPSLPSVAWAIQAQIDERTPQKAAYQAIDQAGRWMSYFDFLLSPPPQEAGQLWEMIFSQDSYKPKEWLEGVDLHLFALSAWTPLQQKLFEQLKAELFFWVLSPCCMFWEDLLSAKQSARWLGNCGKKLRGVETLERLLEETNPLLANNGRLGRRWMRTVRLDDQLVQEAYSVPYPFIEALPEEVCVEEGPRTVLTQIQKELLLLQPPGSFVEDTSIVLSQAPSVRREVEILKENLSQLLVAHPEVQPKDILILVPHLERYTPFLMETFSKGPLKIRLLEMQGLWASPSVRAFSALLALRTSRWALGEILALVQQSAFRSPLTLEEWQIIERWAEQVAIFWGKDGQHRQQVSQVRWSFSEEKGTWKEGLRRLTEAWWFPENHPLALSFGQMDLLERFFDFFEQLELDIAVFSSSEAAPLALWADRLEALAEKYLELQENDPLLASISPLREVVHEREIPFEAVYPHVESAWRQISSRFLGTDRQTIRVAPWMPMRAIPAAIIALLGMNEGQVPAPVVCTQEERKMHALGQLPYPTEYDRYLFLELILSARRALVFSYVQSDEEGPSLLLQELIDYCGGTLKAKVYSEEAFFEGNFIEPSMALEETPFLLAQKMQCGLTPKKLSLPPPQKIIFSHEGPKIITIEEWQRTLRHCIRAYAHKQAGIQLYPPTSPHYREVQPRGALFARWVVESLKSDKKNALEQIKKECHWPTEPFGSLFVKQWELKIEQIEKSLAMLGIGKGQLFDLEWSSACRKSEQVGPTSFRMPALLFPYRGGVVEVVGRLPLLCPQGSIAWQEWKDELRLPFLLEQLLLAASAVEEIGSDLILVQKKERKSLADRPLQPQIERLLDFYFLAHQQPSLLLPSLLSPLAARDELLFFTKLAKWEALQAEEDPYMHWFFSRYCVDSRAFAAWTSIAEDLCLMC